MTNTEVMERIIGEKSFWNNIVAKRNEWIGHIMRYEALLKLIIEET